MKKLIYIGGASRSGTTLIGNVFSNSTNAVFLGEMFRFFIYRNNDNTRKVPVEQTYCGCGKSVNLCDNNIYNDLVKKFPYNQRLYSQIRMSKLFYSINDLDSSYIQYYWSFISNHYNMYEYFIDSSKMGKLYNILKPFSSDSYFIWVYRPIKEVIRSWSKDKSYLGRKSFISSVNLFLIEFFWSFIAFYSSKSNKRLFIHFNKFKSNPNLYIEKYNRMTGLSIPSFVNREMELNKVNHSLAGNPSKGDQVYNVILK